MTQETIQLIILTCLIVAKFSIELIDEKSYR